MNLEQDILAQIEAGFSYGEIVRNLQEQGYAVEDIKASIEKANVIKEQEFVKRRPILTNKFFPLGIFILNIVFFFLVLPNYFASEYYLFGSLLGGLICLISCLFVFARLLPSVLDKFPIGVGLTAVASLFIFAALYIYKGTNYKSNLLLQDGIVKRVRIVESDKGTRFRRHRLEHVYSIRVHFVNHNGYQQNLKIESNEYVYENYQIGDSIDIVYSESHPDMIHLLMNDQERAKYPVEN